MALGNFDLRIAYFMAKRLMKLSPATRIRHWEPSVLCSADDDTQSNSVLTTLALSAAAEAYQASLKVLTEEKRNLPDAKFYQVYPGEHYRLLYILAQKLAPTKIIEIGTYTGMGSAALFRGMPQGCHLTTFDVIAWDKFQSHLSAEDFASGQLTQHLDDLSDPNVFSRYLDIFNRTELIFCDAPKDGAFENRFLENLKKIKPKSNCLLVLDDIRVMNMIDVWRSIKSPKLDMTSFGHWSGTGLVDLTDGLQYK